MLLNKRTANFNGAESDILIALVKKYQSVIECLKTDSVNARMKKEAWAKIEIEFNCQSSETPRTAAVLKNKYDNIKRNVKKLYADEKTFHRGTGGGPNISFPSSSIASTVGEILQTRMTGESPVYDSDVCKSPKLLEQDDNTNCIEEEVVTINNLSTLYDDIDLDNNISEDNVQKPPNSKGIKRDWTSYTPADLKSQSNLTATDAGVSKKHKTYQDKITSWASSRASLTDLQQSAFKSQHDLKMKLMQEKHDLEQKRLSEKHEIEMKNLMLQTMILESQLGPKKEILNGKIV